MVTVALTTGASKLTQRTPAALASSGTALAGSSAAKALMIHRSLVTMPPIRATKPSRLVSLTSFCTMTPTVSSGRSAAMANNSGWARGAASGTGATTINGNSSATTSKNLRALAH